MKSRLLFRILLLTGIVVALGLTTMMLVMAHRHQSHRRLFQSARSAYANGDFAEAETAFTRYLKIDPNQEEAWRCLADIYRKQGDTIQEARCWRRLSHLNPMNEEYLRECIQVLYRNHDYARLGDTFLRMPEEKCLDYREIYTLTRFKLAPQAPDTAKLIEEEQGTTYPCIMLCKDFEPLMEQLSAVPCYLIVDKNGEPVTGLVIAAR